MKCTREIVRPVFGGGTVPRLIDPGSHSVAIILQFAEVTTRVGRHSELPRLNFSINIHVYVVFEELQVFSLIM